jgi:hypothetical protein
MSIADAFPTTARDLQDMEHAKNPQPGDWWHEMFSPVCVVLAVAAGLVIYCDKTKSTSKDRWTWDLTVRKSKTLQEFHDWLQYNTIPDRYMASVEPGAHKWVLEHL